MFFSKDKNVDSCKIDGAIQTIEDAAIEDAAIEDAAMVDAAMVDSTELRRHGLPDLTVANRFVLGVFIPRI